MRMEDNISAVCKTGVTEEVVAEMAARFGVEACKCEFVWGCGCGLKK